MTPSIQTLMRALWSLLFAALFVAGMALAQQEASPDYTAWETTAGRAEAMVAAERATDERYETLRSQVVLWREEFLVAKTANAPRIQTLQAQLTALGPQPEDGPEATEISETRTTLSQQLAEARAPVVRAEAAHSRADAIIGEIDRIIRDRQTDALLELGPSPLNPVHWPNALVDLQTSISGFGAEINDSLSSQTDRGKALQNLPLILAFFVIGIMLIARGQGWAQAGVSRLRSHSRRGSGVFRFLLSLGQILLPYLGVVALLQAISATGFAGNDWNVILGKLPLWAAMLFGIRWLADQAFNQDDAVAALPLPAEERPKARRLASFLALLYVLESLNGTLIEVDGLSAASAAVMQFPVLVLSGYVLFRLGRVRNDAAMIGSKAAREAGTGDFRLRFARLLGRAIQIVGVLGPVMAAIGYFRVGEALVYPAIATLALVGFLMVLQRFINNLYELITGRDAERTESLVPVLAGFLLALSAMPLLALIWGAREADLSEIWRRAQEGITLGGAQITPTSFIVVILVFAVGYMLTRLLQGALRATVLPKTKIDQGGQNAIVSGVGYIGIFSAVVVSVTAGGLDLSSLAIVAGALSVGIGFGLQNIVSNFVSGIILLIERPISEGDWIEVGGIHGTVKNISVRSTRIETFDRFDVIIPNADFVSGRVANYTRGNSLGRIMVEVGVAYGTDTRKVERILLNIARQHDMVLMNPAPGVDFVGFGADSLDFRIRAVLRDVNYGLAVRTEMRHQIMERFTEEGIEIPFGQRDIWLRNPEALANVMAPGHNVEDKEEPRITSARPAEPERDDGGEEL
jgi:potassium efflux system protein